MRPILATNGDIYVGMLPRMKGLKGSINVATSINLAPLGWQTYHGEFVATLLFSIFLHIVWTVLILRWTNWTVIRGDKSYETIGNLVVWGDLWPSHSSSCNSTHSLQTSNRQLATFGKRYQIIWGEACGKYCNIKLSFCLFVILFFCLFVFSSLWSNVWSVSSLGQSRAAKNPNQCIHIVNFTYTIS